MDEPTEVERAAAAKWIARARQALKAAGKPQPETEPTELDKWRQRKDLQ
jgi:hypothetical protein